MCVGSTGTGSSALEPTYSHVYLTHRLPVIYSLSDILRKKHFKLSNLELTWQMGENHVEILNWSHVTFWLCVWLMLQTHTKTNREHTKQIRHTIFNWILQHPLFYTDSFIETELFPPNSFHFLPHSLPIHLRYYYCTTEIRHATFIQQHIWKLGQLANYNKLN